MTAYPFEKKQCPKCNLQKYISNFGKCSKSKWGIKSSCRACLRELDCKYARQKRAALSDEEKCNRARACKAWRNKKKLSDPDFYKKEYYKNHDKNKQKSKDYYQNNTDKCLKSQRNWRHNNIDKSKLSSNGWKKNNPDKVKKYRQNNKKRYSEHARKRRALKHQSSICVFTSEELDNRMSVFGYKCAYCRGPFEHVDHVIPLSRGGMHCLSNLRPACKSCNLSKHAKKLNEWLSEAA